MNPKLIICIDGLGKDLISKEGTPFLYEFGRKYYLSTLETLFAFTGLEYSFFVGKPPYDHKVWLEFIKSDRSIFDNWLLRCFCFNKKLRTYVGAAIQYIKGRTWISGLYNIPGNKLKYFDTCIEKGLWELDFFQMREFSFYKWPFFVTKKGHKQRKKIILNYESDEERLNRLTKVKRKEIYYTQLMSVDKAIHKFGKKSNETKDALKNIDEIIEKYVSDFIDKNKNGQVFLWSDHGFADIVEYIDLEKVIPQRKDYGCFIAGTTVSFWFENELSRSAVFRAMSKVEGVRMLDDKIAAKYRIPLSPKYGDSIFFIDKEKYFFPNYYQKSQREKFVAMHGYPDDEELSGILISNRELPNKLKIYEAIEYIL